MNSKVKKVIAKEFLIFLLVFVIGGFTIGFLSLKNQWENHSFEKRKDNLNAQILLKRDSLSLVSNPTTELYNFLKLNELTNLTESVFISKYSNPIESEKIWAYFKDNGLTEKDFASFYKKYFNEKGYREFNVNGSSYLIPEQEVNGFLEDFPKAIELIGEVESLDKHNTHDLPLPPPKGLTVNSNLSKSKIDSLDKAIGVRNKLQTEVSSLQAKLNNDNLFRHLHSQEEIFKSGIYAGLAAFFSLFFLRYLFYAIRWSIKTLKSPPIEKP